MPASCGIPRLQVTRPWWSTSTKLALRGLFARIRTVCQVLPPVSRLCSATSRSRLAFSEENGRDLFGLFAEYQACSTGGCSLHLSRCKKCLTGGRHACGRAPGV